MKHLLQTKCIIIGNGEFDKIHPDYTADYVIGADVFTDGVNLIVGDFDTLNAEEVPDGIETVRFPSEKNESDLELAVEQAVKRGFNTFYIYGALGGRLDHTLASIAVLTSIAKRGMTGWLIGENEIVTAVTDGRITLNNRNCVLSIFPAGESAEGVTLTGMKYPLDNAVISNDNSLGLSNVVIGDNAAVEVKDGTLIVILSEIT